MSNFVVPIEGIILTSSSLFFDFGEKNISSTLLLVERLSLSNIPMICLPKLEGEELVPQKGEELKFFENLPKLESIVPPPKSLFFALKCLESSGKWGLSPQSTIVVVNSRRKDGTESVREEDMESVRAHGWKIVHLTDEDRLHFWSFWGRFGRKK